MYLLAFGEEIDPTAPLNGYQIWDLILDESHLSNSVNIDVLGDYFSADVAALDKTKSYAIYCRSGKRSVDASEAMDQMGFSATFNLNGGIIEWIDSGRDIVSN
jgi:phage shock protein E